MDIRVVWNETTETGKFTRVCVTSCRQDSMIELLEVMHKAVKAQRNGHGYAMLGTDDIIIRIDHIMAISRVEATQLVMDENDPYFIQFKEFFAKEEHKAFFAQQCKGMFSTKDVQASGG